MNNEHLAVYAAFLCIVWIGGCGCGVTGSGVELTTIIDILAGCKRVCWAQFFEIFGWSRESWWESRWRNCWNAGWHLPLLGWASIQSVEADKPSPLTWIHWIRPCVPWSKVIVSAEHTSVLLFICMIIYVGNVMAKRLDEKGTTFIHHHIGR